MKTSSGHPYRVLIADDQADIRDALRLLLKREGYETQGAQSPSEALAAVEAREFDAGLMDLNYARDTTSGQEGLDLLPRIQMVDGTLPVIGMTAWSSVEVAVEAMRRGARDFIPKPWDNHRLLTVLRTQIDLRQALRQASRLGGGKPVAAGGVAANDDCGVGGDAAGAGFDRAYRGVRRECADHRGAWYRERGGGTDFACAFASIEHADGYGERRRVVGGCV